MFRLGRYHTLRKPSLYWLVPFAEHQIKIHLRVITARIEQQEVITKDNGLIKLSAVIWRRVVDPVRSRKRVRLPGGPALQFCAGVLPSLAWRCRVPMAWMPSR